ncbi:hypothetical protein [Sporohalobacter salinus]|uniref:hypothetical protein n=1 Tax=Sporohalobacter salinus TaxID=1494606 RepID=UPI0019601908|nr:hypothetical protein [Sporohalobacter salinus]MBM7623740.1 hypothetical protein [Sporohalobacter salinus]
MEVSKELKSIEAIYNKSAYINFIHYQQTAEGLKSFQQIDQREISGLEAVDLLEEVEKKGYSVNQLFGKRKRKTEYQDLLMKELKLLPLTPNIKEHMTDVIKVELLNGRYKLIVRIEEYGIPFTWEIFSQVEAQTETEKGIEPEKAAV